MTSCTSPRDSASGLPISRVTSHDGSWAYTLYGGPHETFIHALDTLNAGAVCIDP